MSLHLYRKRIRIIDHHIITKTSGNVESFAKKLGLSIAGAYKFLEEIKEEGFPIAYLRKENRYCYAKPGKMIWYVFNLFFLLLKKSFLSITKEKTLCHSTATEIESPLPAILHWNQNHFLAYLPPIWKKGKDELPGLSKN